jgi:hypothetical protein
MTNPISFLFDWLLGLTRPGADPYEVRNFIANPTQAASQAMGTAVTQAQLTQAASAVVAPAAVYGAGDPIQALQHTVADNNGLTFAPQRVFAPETDFASHNDTALASNNDIGSPRAGEDVQQGVGNVDLDFDFSRDINASNGAVVNTGNAGNIDTTSVHGSGNVVGDHNSGANTGDVYAGQGANVQAGGKNNDLHDSSHDVNTTAGGNVATNTGSGQTTQVGDIDTSGGGAAGGNAGGHGGGLINVGGHGGEGGAAAGGSGGGVIIAPSQNANSNNNNQSAGHDVNDVNASHSIAPVTVGNEHNETALGGDVTHVDHTSGPVDASHDDNSVHHQVDTHVNTQVDNHLF